jgi:hypothetical protein
MDSSFAFDLDVDVSPIGGREHYFLDVLCPT